MYTGRITEIETGSRLVIEAAKTAAGLVAGGSVNVNGTCVPAVRVDGEAGRFAVEICAETAAQRPRWPGTRHQGELELPLRVGDALDGHLVQGHADAIGKVTRVGTGRGGFLRVWIRPPKRFLDEIVAKGSVAVDGVSLTAAEILTDRSSVALIPLTLAGTALAGLRPAHRVNLRFRPVIAFDMRAWHGTVGGQERYATDLSYCNDPRTEDEEEALRLRAAANVKILMQRFDAEKAYFDSPGFSSRRRLSQTALW
jgi:riboflavin synthase alpha subunit